jgi:hypothetical protein
LDYLDSYVFAFVALKNPSFAVVPPAVLEDNILRMPSALALSRHRRR